MKPFVKGLIAPDPPYAADIAEYAIGGVPFFLAALESRTQHFMWDSEQSAHNGEQMIRRLQVSLLTGGIKEITRRQDQLYRLIASGLTGKQWSLQSEEPLVINPPIPDIPDTSIVDDTSLLGNGVLSYKMLDNALNGTPNDRFSDPNGVKPLLTQLLQAYQQGEIDTEEMIGYLKTIALLLG